MGIRAKLLIPITIILLAFVVGMYFYSENVFLPRAKAFFVDEQKELLYTLEPSIIRNLLVSDYANLYNNLDSNLVTHGDHWLGMRLYDSDGALIYPMTTSWYRRATADMDEPMNILIRHIIEDQGQYLGTIELMANWGRHHRESRQYANNMTLFILVGLLLTLSISYWWQTINIRHPILHLQRAATALSKGDYSAALPVAGDDEIGHLSHYFDAMRSNLKKTNSELETALIAIQESETLQRAVLNTMPDGLITTDLQGNIERSNPAAEHIFNCESFELVGQSIFNFICDKQQQVDENWLKQVVEQSRDNDQYEKEIYACRQGNNLLPIALKIRETCMDQGRFYTFNLHDITERRKVEKMKSEFISTVSHELRTPLTSIKGSIALLDTDMAGPLSLKAHEMLGIANRNCERLLHLINDILDIEKITAGKMELHFETLKVTTVVQDAIEANRGFADDYGVSLQQADSVDNTSINVDRDRLMQVMSNLISNAIKFSPKGSRVEVGAVDNDQQVRLFVRDWGKGIAEEFREKIFEKFTQADSSDTRHVGGTGLGLSICKAMTEQLGGQLQFESELNQGSCFYVILPKATTQDLQAAL